MRVSVYKWTYDVYDLRYWKDKVSWVEGHMKKTWKDKNIRYTNNYKPILIVGLIIYCIASTFEL